MSRSKLMIRRCSAESVDFGQNLIRFSIYLESTLAGMESLNCQERLYFPANLGFIRQAHLAHSSPWVTPLFPRLAIQHGVPLLPVYSFGENQLFRTQWRSKYLTPKMRFPFFPSDFQQILWKVLAWQPLLSLDVVLVCFYIISTLIST